MANKPTELKPMDGNVDDDLRLERAGARRGGPGSVVAAQPDNARAQTLREGQNLSQTVREALKARSQSVAAGQGGGVAVPAAESIYDKFDVAMVSNYGPGPAAKALNHYEGTGAPLGDDYGQLPPPEVVVEYARAEGLKPWEAYRDLAGERALRILGLEDQHGILKASHEKAIVETEAARKGKNQFRLATIVLGVFTGTLTVTSIVLAYLLTRTSATNNPPTGEFKDDPFEVNPFMADGFVSGVPARADVLLFDKGVAPASIAIVGADPTSHKLSVTGEGEWSIDDKHRIIFAPILGFSGNPTPQKYVVASAADATKTAEALVTFVYDGDFKVDSIIQTTFEKGKPADIAFLKDAVGVDPSTAKLIGADAGSNDLKKTVAGQGVWSLDKPRSTITFTPAPGFSGEPDAIKFSVAAKAGKPPVERSIILVDVHLAVPDQTKKADPGQAFSVTGFAVPGAAIDQTSLRIDTSGAAATTLSVSGEGKWSIDAQGSLAFAPDASFRQLPSPIKLTLADTLGRRCAPFLLTAVPFTAPYALNEFQTPITPISQMGGVAINCIAATNAIQGDFKINPASVQILGLMPYDNALPDAHYVTQSVELAVTGEGSWKVNTDGTITFTFAASPARWPTPIAYSVQDVQGHESNIGLIWITPNEMTDVKLALAGTNIASDAAFWTKYHDNVLTKQVTLGELISATFLIERSAVLSVSASDLMLIESVAVLDDATVTKTVMDWATKYSASPTNLADVTAFIDDAYVNGRAGGRGIKTLVGSILLATRIIRLRMIRALLHKIMT